MNKYIHGCGVQEPELPERPFGEHQITSITEKHGKELVDHALLHGWDFDELDELSDKQYLTLVMSGII